MDYESALEQQQFQEAVEIRGSQYWLVPVRNEEHPLQRARSLNEDLQRYYGPELAEYEPYEYEPIPKDQKRIRLLKLKAGVAGGREIFCELFEVEYDDKLHTPRRVVSERPAQDGDRGSQKDEPTRMQEINDSYINPNRTERKKRWVEWKKEKPQIQEDRKRDAQDKFLAAEALVKEHKIEYEALSWSWGGDEEDYAVFFLKDLKEDEKPNKRKVIYDGKVPYKKKVKKELALALKYLRRPYQDRVLWIDSVCMDQTNVTERNHQVQMMSRIYSRASQVCVWLGQDRQSTKMAFDFIRNDITHLKNFDMICSNKRYSPKWQALMELMQANWFFRRWVIQEISFASKATVFCGPNQIPWADFAVAVELFVEVETATHRLSEIMQKDEKFRHVNGWFEHVSELGASHLVHASGKVFRTAKSALPITPDEGNPEPIEQSNNGGGLGDGSDEDPNGEPSEYEETDSEGEAADGYASKSTPAADPTAPRCQAEVGNMLDDTAPTNSNNEDSTEHDTNEGGSSRTEVDNQNPAIDVSTKNPSSSEVDNGTSTTFPYDVHPRTTNLSYEPVPTRETNGNNAPTTGAERRFASPANLQGETATSAANGSAAATGVFFNGSSGVGTETQNAAEAARVNEDKVIKKRMENVRTIDPLERRSLLSLEYLVSTMNIFKATEPRDVVYSLIAIARDATPFADAVLRYDDRTSMILTLLNSFLEEKPFFIDYKRPYSDVCRDFVQFVIQRKHKVDPIQALDILCRPWALEPTTGKSIRVHGDEKTKDIRAMPYRLEKWENRQSTIKWTKEDGKLAYRVKKDWGNQKDAWELDPSCAPDVSTSTIKDSDRKDYMEKYMKEADRKGKEWPSIDNGPVWKKPYGWENVKQRADAHKKKMKEAKDKIDEAKKKRGRQGASAEVEAEKDVELPTWIARASQAPFRLYERAGMGPPTAGRAFADPLVGWPADGHRNYNAAQTMGLKLSDLKFRKRPQRGHYSLYVKGFILDEVVEVEDASQQGMIPLQWLILSGWKEPFTDEPPDALWRTLVADRGRDNKNSPYYFARACSESVRKGGALSGSVDTAGLINSEQNSIVAEYCRRVQAVIWKRRMFKTKRGHLGLATKVAKGDKVCIIFGVTVPVILTQFNKRDDTLDNSSTQPEEEFEDQWESLKSCIARMETNRIRKAKSRQKIFEYRDSGEWYEMMQHRRRAKKKLQELAEKERKPSKKKQNEEADNEPPIPGKPPRRQTHMQKKKQAAKDEDPHLYYHFNGECYVHGMMDGEAMRTQFYNGEPNRDFELR